jgi:heptosyltransferase II
VRRLVVFAPNWLGDAVMALPAMRDVAAETGTPVAVAARRSVAPLFSLVPSVEETIVIERHSAIDMLRLGAGLRTGGFDTALLLPNSFASALTATLAGIPNRWGYRTDGRGFLLTRAIDRPRASLHQARYYQHLTETLGCPPGPLEPRIDVSHERRQAGARLLRGAGWDGSAPLVALAPGAAYGSAKKWPLDYYARLAQRLRADRVSVACVGSAADANWSADASRELGILNLVGRTDLPTLAGVLAQCRTLVSNDSGAMHLAAAIGISVTAVFGPTNERETSPLRGGTDPAQQHIVVLSHDVSCRPCMLRECPIDHICMTGIDPDRVYNAVRETL